MYLTPNSWITIGGVFFASTNSVVIERSVNDFVSKATIILPKNFAKQNGKGVLDYIKENDAVTIELGYFGEYNVEFEGYVDKIGSDAPLVIECEGLWHNHKRNELTPKTFTKTKLSYILRYAFRGYTVDCPNVDIETFIIGKVSTYAVAKALRESLGFFTKLDEVEKKVTCYWPYEATKKNEVTYCFGTRDSELLQKLKNRKLFPNIKNRNSLKFERKDASNIKIIGKARTPAGKQISVSVGSNEEDCEKRTRNYGTIGSWNDSNTEIEAKVKELANKDLSIINFDGYKGSITGFGYPLVYEGDTITIVDPEYSEREGSYLVESVKINYSVSSGYERECTISYKVK